MPSRVEVAATIRSRRKALGWRQEDLADRVGVTRKTVINWEKGQEPTENRDVLARVLGVDEGELEVTVELAPSAADRLAVELAGLRAEVHALRVEKAGPASGHTGGASETQTATRPSRPGGRAGELDEVATLLREAADRIARLQDEPERLDPPVRPRASSR